MCRIIEMMILVLPLSRWKEGVRRRHLARCSRCAVEEAAREKAIRTFLTPPWIRENPGMDPKIWTRAERTAAADRHVARVRWRLRIPVAAGTAILAMSALGLLFFWNRDRGTPPTEPTAALETAVPGPRVQVFSAELRGKPAKAYIYQTPRISFVWISPAKEIGG